MALNVLVCIAVAAGGDQVWQKLVLSRPAGRRRALAADHLGVHARAVLPHPREPVHAVPARSAARADARPTRFTILYLASAIGGSLAVWLLDPNQPTLGALRRRTRPGRRVPGDLRSLGHDVTWIVLYIGITALLSFPVPNISWQGHLGGFAVGAALGALFVYQSKRRTRTPDRR